MRTTMYTLPLPTRGEELKTFGLFKNSSMKIKSWFGLLKMKKKSILKKNVIMLDYIMLLLGNLQSYRLTKKALKGLCKKSKQKKRM